MSKINLVIYFFFFTLLNTCSTSMASATETLFYIVKKADWLTHSTKLSYRPTSFSRDGFISLSTPEQVIPTARALFQGQNDLLLLKIRVPTADPLLKWESIAGSDVSYPHYYGDLPRQFVRKVYTFQPGKDGNFALPNDPLLARLMAHAIPKGLVNKFLSYEDWQNTDRFHRLQVNNFQKPKVQLQWWYFDFFLQDGSSVVIAFIPQHWWENPGSAKEKKIGIHHIVENQTRHS